MRFVALALIVLSVSLSLDGCCWVGGDYGFRFAVTVELVDSVTGGSISAVPTGILTDGRYREIMYVAGNHVIGGMGRPGRYDVEITAAGYRTWSKAEIRVPGDFCGGISEPAELTALMVPFGTAGIAGDRAPRYQEWVNAAAIRRTAPTSLPPLAPVHHLRQSIP